MITKVVTVDPLNLSAHGEELREAAEIIKRGGLVAFPTETVYGLGANALDPDAASRIYEAKGRPSDNPLIIHVDSPDGFEKWCEVENHAALETVKRSFTPGPITVIQKKKPMIPNTVTANMDTVAVRCPSNPIARRLIELAGVPIAAPSANTSGRPSPTKACHVIEDMMGRVDMIIDGGECEVGLESTIIMLKKDSVALLRPGGVTLEELEERLGEIEVDKAVLNRLAEGEKPLAPGMKYRHYAPKARVVALKGSDEAVAEFMKRELQKPSVGIMCYTEDGIKGEKVQLLGSRNNKSEMAHRLFDCLRAFDAMLEIQTVYTRLPDTDDIGLALVNRLLKACGYTVMEV